MKVKTKLAILSPLLGLRVLNAKRLARKIRRLKDDTDRYPQSWKNTYILKKAKKTAKNLNLKVSVKGYQNIPKAPAILVPNHASSFDPSLILIALEQTDKESQKPNFEPNFVAKSSLEKGNKYSGFFSILDTHFINRKNPRQALRVLNEFGLFIKENQKLGVVFAEGTRTKTGKISDFEGGAFYLAKKLFLPIVPVTINNSWGITNFNRKGKHNVEIIFHKRLKPIDFISSDKKYLAQRVKKIVESKYKKPTVKSNDSFERKAA